MLKREAEITLQHAEQPYQVLLPPRFVEPVLFPQERDLGLVNGFALALELIDVTGQIVARWQLDDHEYDHADRQ